MMRTLSIHFSGKTIFLLILIAASTVLIPFLNQNQIGMAQEQNNQTSSSLTNQQQPTGISFQIDNTTFSHHMAVVNGVQIHYVIGGHGDPVVLLHGWPETWYEWHKVMPALARNYTVIAPDMRGLGDSSKPLTGYDGKTVAEDIHQLVTKLGFKRIFLVGHDFGADIAYAYAAAHPTEVKRLVVMDMEIAGFAPPGRMPTFWPVFHQVRDLPEALVQGKELLYLTWFFNNLAYNPSAVAPDINEFVSHYSAPGAMRAGFEYYRAVPQDAIENQNYSKTKLTMPVLAVGGSYYPALGGNVTNSALYAMKILAQNVQSIQIPNSGHWGPEERPDFVIKMLDNFFAGNTTNASTSDPILQNQQVHAASLCVHVCLRANNSLHVGSGPTGIAFDPKNGNLYVTNSRDKTVSVISGQNNTVVRTIPCCVQYTYNKVSPSGIAFDSANGNLYVTGSTESPPVISSGGVSVISGQNNTVISNIPCCAADGSPWGITFDAANGNLYVTNTQDFSVSVISGKNNTVIGSPIMVGKVPPGGPYAIAFDPTNGNLYVPILHNYTVTVISGKNNTVIGGPIHVGSYPIGIAFDPTNGNLYVTNFYNNTVSVISGKNNTVLGSPITVGKDPYGVVFDSANGNLYVTNSGDNTVTAISGQNNNVIGTIAVDKTPRGIAFDSANGNLYVANFNNNTVSVISSLNTIR
jgi:YVTN family beta-propeller protein